MYNNDLCFGRGGEFKIMIATDIHEKPDITSDSGKAKSRDTFAFLNAALDTLKPDFVVLGGDNCTDFDSSKGLDGFYPIFERVTRPMRDRGIPFTTVLGNHEHDIDDAYLEKIIDEYEKCDCCVIRNRAVGLSGKLDFYLTVRDGENDGLVLWFADSNNTVSRPDGHIVYDNVHPDQLAWYERCADDIAAANGGKALPAVWFQHIPVPEIYALLRPARLFEVPSCVRGHDHLNKNRYMKKDGCEGCLAEGPDIPFDNSGEFAAWKRTGDVKAAFFGHDHMNDFHGEYDGIIMGQSKTGGFRAYTDGCRSGVRLITVNKNKPGEIHTRMYHFRDFGLKSTSLGPIEKRITDRQSTNMHIAARAGLCVLITCAAAAGISLIMKLRKE